MSILLRLLPPAAILLVLSTSDGCLPKLRATAEAALPLHVPPLRTPASPWDPRVVRFAEGSAPPYGCFAQSRRTGAVACVVGKHGIASEAGERRLSLLMNSDDGVADVLLRVQPSGVGLKLEATAQRALDALMRDGDFVALGPATTIEPNAARAFGKLTVELTRVESALYEAVSSEDLDGIGIKLVVRSHEPVDDAAPAGRTDVLLENTLTAIACKGPKLAVRVLEPSVVLLERECRIDDGAEPEVILGAWLCDSERMRCD